MTLLEIAMPVSKTGTYAAVRFSQKTIDKIKHFCKENGVKNVLRSSKLHTTLLYSRKHLPDYTGQGKIDPAWIGTPTELDVWNTRSEDKDKPSTRCLVLKYKCKELEDRHTFLMDEHGATYDFPDYQPHISLSYDIGDADIEDLRGALKDFGDIEIVLEYSDDLDLDWANKNK
jgi:hypothetical protein